MMESMKHVKDDSLIEQINTVLKNTIEYVFKIQFPEDESQKEESISF